MTRVIDPKTGREVTVIKTFAMFGPTRKIRMEELVARLPKGFREIHPPSNAAMETRALTYGRTNIVVNGRKDGSVSFMYIEDPTQRAFARVRKMLEGALACNFTYGWLGFGTPSDGQHAAEDACTVYMAPCLEQDGSYGSARGGPYG